MFKFTHRFTKISVLMLITVLALFATSLPAFAHEGHNTAPEVETFIVAAGGHSTGNTEVLAFGPSYLQVHRGDTVIWRINGFHNVHFNTEPAELFVVQDVNGTMMPILNPAVGAPTVQNGDTITEAVGINTGLPQDPTAAGEFRLTIDLPEGVYTYFCDVHPGMSGIIEVVADDVVIPTAVEAAAAGSAEISNAAGAGLGAFMQMAATSSPEVIDGNLNVTIGGGAGRATVNQVAPFVAVITAGQSVTWTNPADSVDPHFVNSLPMPEEALQDFVPVLPPPEGQPPFITMGPGFTGLTQSGETVAAGGSFQSPVIMPGQSFTLTFTEPGVYAYTCHIHPGMNGVIVVQPAA